MANGENGWRIERSTIGVVTAVLIAVALIPTGFSAGKYLAEFQSEQQKTSERLTRIEEALTKRGPEDFKRSDMYEWCETASSENKSFTCPDPFALPSYVRRWGRL